MKIGLKKVALVVSVVAVILLISNVYALEIKVNAEKPTFLHVTVNSIDNSTITVVNESGESIKLFAKGRWILISDEVRAMPWIEAMNYVEGGDALIVMTTLGNGNVTRDILLGIKQEDVILVRPSLLKHCAKGHRHSSTYLSFRGEVADTGENYMILERDGNVVLALANGEWVKAGGETVTWKDVSDEFRPGDEVRLFCHNIVVMNDDFAENFGIRGFIWGYSGAIIDLTSGTTLSRK
ncbi:MAG: hypothetical protein J7K49_06285 [Thaumarchaeota archaeon]|nr:hypothetical protein [Nitrososphaerota archaeon]